MTGLEKILRKVEIEQLIGNKSVSVKCLRFDSQSVEVDDVFIAIRGTKTDGHKYINDAINKGAVVVVCEDIPEPANAKITWVKVKNSSLALAAMASGYYNEPSKSLKIVGVTGTNGKTTIATLLYDFFMKMKIPAGLISTNTIRIGQEEVEATHTTPDALRINGLFDQMLKHNCKYCFMEVSSHAIVQNRVAFIDFVGGIFTNITQDHLDYHVTMDNYIRAKKKFFDSLSSQAFALYNKDDKNGSIMVQNTRAKIYSYALKTMADYKCIILEESDDGLTLLFNGKEVDTSFVGEFNAYNLNAVFATAQILGYEPTDALTVLSSLRPVSGRFEKVINQKGILAIVDYAHTPDAIKNILTAIQKTNAKKNRRIITVIGCGGDRDKGKRPKMGKIAFEMSTQVIFTSDNPRSENPKDIIEQMLANINDSDQAKVIQIINREEAIKVACSLAGKGDVLLVAGKGHETYQIIEGQKSHFDDREVLTKYLK